MRRSKAQKNSTNDSGDGDNHVIDVRDRTESKDRLLGPEFSGCSPEASRLVLVESLWSGVFLGLSLTMGPLIVRHHSKTAAQAGTLVGAWAASLYIGRIIGLVGYECAHRLRLARFFPPTFLKSTSTHIAIGLTSLGFLLLLGLSSTLVPAFIARAGMGACFAFLSAYASASSPVSPLRSATGIRSFTLGLVSGAGSVGFFWKIGGGDGNAHPGLLPCLMAAGVMLLFGAWAVVKPTSFSTPSADQPALQAFEMSLQAITEESSPREHPAIIPSSVNSGRVLQCRPPPKAPNAEQITAGGCLFFDVSVIERGHPVGGNIEKECFGERDIPRRVVRGCGADLDEARRRWALTRIWRREYAVDTILDEPQPYFDIIKRYYPHFIHGRSKSGHPIYIEQLGKINMPSLIAEGVSVHVLMRHYVFNSEFLWSRVAPQPDSKCITLMDLNGLEMRDLAGDAMEYVRALTKVCQEHYMDRSDRIFVVNAPFWFAMPWKVVSPLLHPNTRKKVTILSVGKFEPLWEVIDRTALPAVYGGTSIIGQLGESEEERALCELAHSNTASSNTAHITLSRNASSSTIDDSSISSSGGRDVTTVTGALAGFASSLFSPWRVVPHAHLGKENRFTYDRAKGIWVLEGESEDEGEEDEMEARLVKAIQAASLSSTQHQSNDDEEEILAEPHDRLLGDGTPSLQSTSTDCSKRLGQLTFWQVVKHSCWRCLHLASLQMVPLFLLGSTDDGGLGIDQSAASVILVAGPASLLLSLMLLDWLCIDCLTNILSRPIGQLLKVAVALQVTGLGIISLLPYLSKLPAEVEGAALVGGIAMIEGSLIVSFNHMGIWLPSMPDYLSACGTWNWLATLGDSMGALLGPLLYALAVSHKSPNLHPTMWLQLIAAINLVSCLCF